jgi:hypothetical protein
MLQAIRCVPFLDVPFLRRLAYLQDFGVWNISYQSVTCTSNWSGSKDAAALGSVPSLGDGGCCPANPTVSPGVGSRVASTYLTWSVAGKLQ